MKQLLISFGIIFLITSCIKHKHEDVDIFWNSIEQINDEIICRFQVQVDEMPRSNVDAGIYWGTSATPAVDGVKVPSSNGEQVVINEFKNSTDYYFQAYCNYNGETYLTNVMSLSIGKGWKILPNSPSEDLRHVAISPSGVVHVIGSYGAHYYSTDQGANWIQVNHSDQANLAEMKFINDNVVYMMADWSVRKSVDGGLSWTDITLPVSTSIGAVLFYNENTLFFSYNQYFYYSYDSGTTWATSVMAANQIETFSFVTEQIGYAVSWDGYIIKTTDAGMSWTPLTLTPISIYGDTRELWFLNEDVGCVGMSEYVLTTADGGYTWQNNFYGGVGAYINAMDFCDDQTGAISAGHGILAVTKNGGQTWDLEFVPGDKENILGIDLFSNSLGFAIAEGGIIYKFD